MNAFELTFSLFGLLLGLSLAEVLGGFARGLKRHGRHRLGLLTPMLSVFLLYDIATFWIMAYRMRDALPLHIATLVGGLAVTGLYYFAAVLVWPEEGTREWDDLDGWMLTHKRQILLSVFAANAVSFASGRILAPETFHLGPVEYVLLSLYFLGLLAGALAPGRRTTIAALALLLALYGLDLFVNVGGIGGAEPMPKWLWDHDPTITSPFAPEPPLPAPPGVDAVRWASADEGERTGSRGAGGTTAGCLVRRTLRKAGALTPRWA